MIINTIEFKIRDAQLDAHPYCLLKAQIAPTHVTRTVLAEISIGEDSIFFNACFYNMKFDFHNATFYKFHSYSF